MAKETSRKIQKLLPESAGEQIIHAFKIYLQTQDCQEK